MNELKPIAHIETDFPTKFGIPRQSGLVRGLRGRIVFEPEYRIPEALRGLENFSHIWLLWDFSEARREGAKWQPTVRPPRLGGNRRMGVFATRSPFRPNNIGLSSVRILSIDLHTPDGPVIEVEGVDLMNGTPIFDIKPYLAFTDSHPDATGSLLDVRWKKEEGRGKREGGRWKKEEGRGKMEEGRWGSGSADSAIVNLHSSIIEAYDAEHVEALREILLSDPRPHYHDDPDRIYAFLFAGREVKFRFSPGRIDAWTE